MTETYTVSYVTTGIKDRGKDAVIKNKYKFLVLGIIMLSVGLSMEIIAVIVVKENPTLDMVMGLGGNVLFLSGIGMTIYGTVYYWREKKKDIVVSTGKQKEQVSIKRQTIFACIPILDLYATYKIEKFRLYFIIILSIGFGLHFGIGKIVNYPYTIVVDEAITIPIAVYLIRRWSKKWNEQFTKIS